MRKNILTVNNAKTTKGESLNVLTGILYLQPDNGLCPFAKSAGCEKDCLTTAGRMKMSLQTEARIRKTERFKNDYENFMLDLVYSIKRIELEAETNGMKPAVRLNGTSDILWERQSLYYKDKYYNNLMEMFPNVQFYDYTKIARRFERPLPPNYDLTFSYSGTNDYQPSVEKALKLKARIAIVFNGTQPDEYFGMKVVNGDEHDVRFIEPQGVIVGLKAKGKAVKSDSLFIIKV